jgi:hypothetical protein
MKTEVVRIYRITWLDDDSCIVRSIVNGCVMSKFRHGVWYHDQRLPDDIMVAAMGLRPDRPSTRTQTVNLRRKG